MRDLVVKYLSQGMSRRGFVSGLTKAGLTVTAAQSVLSSVATVSHAQTGPTPTPPAGAAAAAAAAPATAGQATTAACITIVGSPDALT